ncbi:chloride channel protein, partial [Escherichia coli]
MGCAVTLALAGMGAFFTGVARVPITATIIVFEITTDFNMLLPLMICSITAFLVGEKIAPGSIYDRLLELQGIFLPGSRMEFVQPSD